MVYRVWFQFWHENSVGEQGNGPKLWLPGVYGSRREAEAAAEPLRDHGPYGGTWAGVEEAPRATPEGA